MSLEIVFVAQVQIWNMPKDYDDRREHNSFEVVKSNF